MEIVKICRGVHGCCLSNSGKDAKQRSASMRKLFMAVLICVIFMCIEIVGGIKANSLSILADAAHLLSDIASFFISIFSIWASSSWEPTQRHSYGFYRIEILGALVSIQLIWLITGIILYEAVMRMIHGTAQVHGMLMFLIAAVGLLVNIAIVVLLGYSRDENDTYEHEHNDSHSIEIDIITVSENDEQRKLKKNKQSINVHSAYLHALGDSLQSFGVMIGGAILWYKPEWKVVDLLCTLIFSVIVMITTINMIKSILAVLMESSPGGIDSGKLEKGVCEVEGVVSLHELHLWSITVGKVLLSCHVTIIPEADFDVVLDGVIKFIRTEFNINHVTIQMERERALK